MKKRWPAVRCRIRDIIAGHYVSSGDLSPSYVLLPYGMKAYKTMVYGVVTQTYVNDEKTYGFVVIEDGTGRIRAKFFQKTKLVDEINKGDCVAVIGRVREYADERYIVVDGIRKMRKVDEELVFRMDVMKSILNIIKKVREIADKIKGSETLEEVMKLCSSYPKELVEGTYELRSHLESRKIEEVEMEDRRDAREIILNVIKNNDEGDSVDYTTIVQLAGLPESVVEKTLDELLEEGTCYEPKPGKIKLV